MQRFGVHMGRPQGGGVGCRFFLFSGVPSISVPALACPPNPTSRSTATATPSDEDSKERASGSNGPGDAEPNGPVFPPPQQQQHRPQEVKSRVARRPKKEEFNRMVQQVGIEQAMRSLAEAGLRKPMIRNTLLKHLHGTVCLQDLKPSAVNKAARHVQAALRRTPMSAESNLQPKDLTNFPSSSTIPTLKQNATSDSSNQTTEKRLISNELLREKFLFERVRRKMKVQQQKLKEKQKQKKRRLREKQKQIKLRKRLKLREKKKIERLLKRSRRMTMSKQPPKQQVFVETPVAAVVETPVAATTVVETPAEPTTLAEERNTRRWPIPASFDIIDTTKDLRAKKEASVSAFLDQLDDIPPSPKETARSIQKAKNMDFLDEGTSTSPKRRGRPRRLKVEPVALQPPPSSSSSAPSESCEPRSLRRYDNLPVRVRAVTRRGYLLQASEHRPGFEEIDWHTNDECQCFVASRSLTTKELAVGDTVRCDAIENPLGIAADGRRTLFAAALRTTVAAPTE